MVFIRNRLKLFILCKANIKKVGNLTTVTSDAIFKKSLSGIRITNKLLFIQRLIIVVKNCRQLLYAGTSDLQIIWQQSSRQNSTDINRPNKNANPYN